MPSDVSRYFIEITNIRVECLQDISEEDCFKEGILKNGLCYFNHIRVHSFLTPKDAFCDLINSICGKNTWESNPYVMVLDYKLIYKFV